MRRRSVAALLAILVLLGAALFLMFDFQDHFIFPRHAVGPAGPLPKGAEQLTLTTSDRATLHGIHIPPSKPDPARRLIIGFAGNGWNSQEAATYLHDLYPDVEIVQFHYRGYRPSTGEPSAKALLADALLIHDHAVARFKPRQTIAVGFSIGTGVAAYLAGHRALDGLILVTPFDSLKAVAAEQFPWLPVAALFRHEIDAKAALGGVDVPTAIIAGGNDTLISAARTDALRKGIRHLSYDRTIAGAGHNDIYQRQAFREAMHEALARVSS